jgi:hypothetical protein
LQSCTGDSFTDWVIGGFTVFFGGIAYVIDGAKHGLEDLGHILSTPNNPQEPYPLLPFPRNPLHLGDGKPIGFPTVPPAPYDPLGGFVNNDPGLYFPPYTGNTGSPDNHFIPVLNADHYITTPNGVTLPPNKDFDLVPTSPGGAMPDNPEEKWLQIHGTEPHNNIDPHTHYPKVNVSPTGKGNTTRPFRPTTDVDIERANESLQSGEMRLRRGRKDEGGTP